jgi:acyl carrier protein
VIKNELSALAAETLQISVEPIDKSTSLSRDVIEDELRALAAKTLQVSAGRIDRNTSLSRDIHADSLAMLALVYCIETRFRVNIESRNIDLLDNLVSAARYVESLLASQR